MPPKTETPAAEPEVDVNELTAAVVTKYQTAGDIANKSLATVIAATVAGAKIIDLCTLGDKSVEELCKGVYEKKGKVPKGISFPTTVSVGNIICHLSPISTDEEANIVLKTGDTVRIEVGAHIDGYVAQVAHTVVIGATKEAPVTGRQADVIQAAFYASEAAMSLLQPGKTNWDITDAIQKISQEYECKPIEGMLSHQVQKDTLDGPKQIILNPNEHQRKEIEKVEFEAGQAYSIDILISTGEGKPKTQETQTRVFKRNAGVTYNLKMQTSRTLFSEVKTKCGGMAFSIRQLEDEKKAKMGILECVAHNLVIPYNVLYEKEDAIIAHFMYTVLILPSGPVKVSKFPFDQELIKSDKQIKDAELKELTVPVKKSKKNKKKKAAAGEEDATEDKE